MPDTIDPATLDDEAGFHRRHIGPSAGDRREMLALLGLASVE
ncbi:MAG: hypothetical protein WD225_12195 [Ilumatobacteraceae bacterium]